eukprot:9358755-Pyramimonas_sp.AAC.1
MPEQGCRARYPAQGALLDDTSPGSFWPTLTVIAADDEVRIVGVTTEHHALAGGQLNLPSALQNEV